MSASGNATVKASVINVHGGVQKTGNASLSPAPITGAATLADPLSGLPLPSTSGLTNFGSESLSGNSSATINPGIYSQISASGNAKLTLNSGLYIIEGGGFSISGNASVTGSGVTIFNAGSKYPTTGGTYGSISLSGNGTITLSPPTTGTYAGVVIFQPADNTKALSVSGNGSAVTGEIYAPAAQLNESGNGQLNASIVVDTMTSSGNGVANAVVLKQEANLLVPDLIAYHGQGKTNSRGAITVMQRPGLVKNGAMSIGGNTLFSGLESSAVTIATTGLANRRQPVVAQTTQDAGRATPVSRSAVFSAVARVHGDLQEESSLKGFFGDLAFEQLSSKKSADGNGPDLVAKRLARVRLG